MKAAKLAALRFFALLFLLPGLAGLIVSAMISTHYLDVLPQVPDQATAHIIPRNIHGTLVYQSPEEDSRLTVVEYSSVGIFLIGLVLGLAYLEQWGALQTRAAEEERELAHHAG